MVQLNSRVFMVTKKEWSVFMFCNILVINDGDNVRSRTKGGIRKVALLERYPGEWAGIGESSSLTASKPDVAECGLELSPIDGFKFVQMTNSRRGLDIC
jgi:hypothetical protein